MSNTNLDRSFGLFNGVASSAYTEGLIRADEFAQSCALERKNQRIDSLIDEVENLEDNYELLQIQNNKLKAEIKNLRKSNDNDIDDYNALVDRFNKLLEANEKLRAENSKLKENAHIQKIENSTRIEHLQDMTSRELKEADAGFAHLYRTVNNSRQSTEFSLKVVYSQNRIRGSFIETLIGMGVVSREMYENHFSQKVLEQDGIDKSRNGVTYSESLSWMKVHNPNMYNKLKF